MNQEDHNLRRRLGAFAVLSAAAGAASAAAMILATPAFADPTDDAVPALVCTACTPPPPTELSLLDTALGNDGASPLAVGDENAFLSEVPAAHQTGDETLLLGALNADSGVADTRFVDAIDALAAHLPADPTAFQLFPLGIEDAVFIFFGGGAF